MPPALVAVALTACGGGPNGVVADVSAATFVASFPASEATAVASDRLANTSETENRLDVIRPGGDLAVSPVYASLQAPDPFEFVRDPLTAGSLLAFVASATTVVAVTYPLVDPTPNGRVLAGRLIALDATGKVVATDWDDVGDARITALVAWGADHDLTPVDTIQKAIAGLNDPGDPLSDEAAGLVAP